VAWNYASALYEALAGLFVVAYVVRRIAVAEYGLLLLAIAVCSLMYLLDLGLGNLLVQAYVAIGRENLRRVSTLLGTSFITLAGMGAMAASVVVLLALRLPWPFQIPSPYVHHAVLVFILIAIATMIGLPTTAVEHVYQAFQRFDRINQVQFLITSLRVILTVVLLAKGLGVVGLAALHLGLLAVRLLALLVGLRWSVAGVSLDLKSFDWGQLKPWLRLGGWSALDGVARQIASAADSFILGIFGSINSVAIFGLGSKLPTQLSAMVTRGAMVILPSLTQHHVNDDKAELRRLFLTAQRLVITGALPVVVLGCLCARPLIEFWAGSAYVQAATVMQWLLLAALSLALEYSADLLLYACGEVKTAALIATVESIANILVSLLLVFRYDAVGLAAGTAITHWMINACWYTPAACRIAGLRLPEFVKAIFIGQVWGVGLLVIASAALMLLRSSLSPATFLAAGVFAGVIYFSVWGLVVVRPAWRLRNEVAH
jgi:O-antigen/teichoic acid export membrane protein